MDRKSAYLVTQVYRGQCAWRRRTLQPDGTDSCCGKCCYYYSLSRSHTYGPVWSLQARCSLGGDYRRSGTSFVNAGVHNVQVIVADDNHDGTAQGSNGNMARPGYHDLAVSGLFLLHFAASAPNSRCVRPFLVS